MTRYTHPDFDGTFPRPRGQFVTIGEQQIGSAFFATSSPQEIEALGFVEHVEPEPEPPTFEQRKAALQDAIRAKRWQVETGGVMVNGAPIQTDEISQAKITGAVNLFQNDAELTSIDWEAMPGIWVEIDQATMIAIGVAVGRHVQACFSHAKALSQAVAEAEDEAALDAIDINDGWPS